MSNGLLRGCNSLTLRWYAVIHCASTFEKALKRADWTTVSIIPMAKVVAEVVFYAIVLITGYEM
jgi:hypothetical protein